MSFASVALVQVQTSCTSAGLRARIAYFGSDQSAWVSSVLEWGT